MGLRSIGRRLGMCVRRRQLERDLAEEMRMHVDLRTARNVERGAKPGDARRDALRRFGGALQFREASREAWGWRSLDELGRALRAAGRTARRRPVFPIAVIGTLALAIGANLAMFTVIDRVALHPLDVPKASALLTVQRTYDLRGVRRQQNYVLWEGVESLRHAMTAAVAFSTASADRATKDMVVRTPDGMSTQVSGRFLSANYFRVLGLTPAFGRNFGPADDTREASPTVILAHAFWRTRFASDRGVVGQTLWVNGTAATVVGVAPSSFTGTDLGVDPPAIYLPLMTGSRLATDIGSQTDGHGRGMSPVRGVSHEGFVPSVVSPLSTFVVVGRPTDGHGRVQVDAELPALLSGSGWNVVPLTSTMLPVDAQRDIRQFLVLVAAAVALTFTIGCANLAGLLLARAEERRAELAVRAALGAGRRRLVLELAVETGVLVVAGTAAAGLVGRWMLTGLSAYVLPGHVAVSALPEGFGADVWFVAFGSMLLAVAFVAVVPALRATRGTLVQEVARRSSARVGGIPHSRCRPGHGLPRPGVRRRPVRAHRVEGAGDRRGVRSSRAGLGGTRHSGGHAGRCPGDGRSDGCPRPSGTSRYGRCPAWMPRRSVRCPSWSRPKARFLPWGSTASPSTCRSP